MSTTKLSVVEAQDEEDDRPIDVIGPNPDYFVDASVRTGGDVERRIIGSAHMCADDSIMVGLLGAVQLDDRTIITLIPNAARRDTWAMPKPKD